MRSFVGGADEGINSQTLLKEIDTNSKYSTYTLFTFKSNKQDYDNGSSSNESLFVDSVFGTDVEKPPHKKANINQNKSKTTRKGAAQHNARKQAKSKSSIKSKIKTKTTMKASTTKSKNKNKNKNKSQSQNTNDATIQTKSRLSSGEKQVQAALMKSAREFQNVSSNMPPRVGNVATFFSASGSALDSLDSSVGMGSFGNV